MNVKESSYFKKWWLKLIRERNYFGFRYWWFNWLILVSGVFLFIFYFYRQESQPYASCCYNIELNDNFTSIYKSLENCCICDVPYNYQDSIVRDTVRPPTPEPPRRNDSIPKPPSKNCRVHFAGTLISDQYVEGHISKIYEADGYSEYVGGGFYPNCKRAFPKADKYSFDGIAVDKGTRLIIYSKPNFKGQILVDIVGPAIMNNEMFRNDATLGDFVHKRFIEPLESNYPKSCRKWSGSNMRSWSNGSCKIICSE